MALSELISNSETLSKMDIFHDVAYISLSIVGSILSTAGTIYRIRESSDLDRKKRKFSEGVKAFLFGFMLTPLLFMIFVASGGQVITLAFNINVSEASTSFWFILAVISSWFSSPIGDEIAKRIEYQLKNNKK